MTTTPAARVTTCPVCSRALADPATTTDHLQAHARRGEMITLHRDADDATRYMTTGPTSDSALDLMLSVGYRVVMPPARGRGGARIGTARKVTLSDDEWDALGAIADRHDVSRSQVVRWAVADFLAAN